MSRKSAFEQDFHDLHGDHIETVQAAPGSYRAQPRSEPPLMGFSIFPVRRVPNVGLRLTVGVLGLFWSIVLIAILAGMLIVVGVAIWALAATSGQTVPS